MVIEDQISNYWSPCPLYHSFISFSASSPTSNFLFLLLSFTETFCFLLFLHYFNQEASENKWTRNFWLRQDRDEIVWFFEVWDKTENRLNPRVSVSFFTRPRREPTFIKKKTKFGLILLKVEYILNGSTNLYEILNLNSWDSY